MGPSYNTFFFFKKNLLNKKLVDELFVSNLSTTWLRSHPRQPLRKEDPSVISLPEIVLGQLGCET
jgi:hypothetical protein